jgi:hypothetical protein
VPAIRALRPASRVTAGVRVAWPVARRLWCCGRTIEPSRPPDDGHRELHDCLSATPRSSTSVHRATPSCRNSPITAATRSRSRRPSPISTHRCRHISPKDDHAGRDRPVRPGSGVRRYGRRAHTPRAAFSAARADVASRGDSGQLRRLPVPIRVEPRESTPCVTRSSMMAMSRNLM